MEFTDYIAIYAALLSTFVFVWNFSRSRAKITVTLVWGMTGSGKNLKTGVFLGIQNPSIHTVHINSASLLYPYRRISLHEKLFYIFKYRRIHRYIGWVHNSMVFKEIKTGLPTSIEPRNSHSIFIPDENIHEMLEEDGAMVIAAQVQDALWRNKYSAPFKMDH